MCSKPVRPHREIASPKPDMSLDCVVRFTLCLGPYYGRADFICIKYRCIYIALQLRACACKHRYICVLTARMFQHAPALLQSLACRPAYRPASHADYNGISLLLKWSTLSYSSGYLCKNPVSQEPVLWIGAAAVG